VALTSCTGHRAAASLRFRSRQTNDEMDVGINGEPGPRVVKLAKQGTRTSAAEVEGSV